MRIGILTLNLNYNYGGILQAYALISVLKTMGHEPLLIQRKKNSKLSRRIINLISFIFNRRTYWFEGLLSRKTYSFINKYIPNKTSHLTQEELMDVCNEYKLDAIIVGSDQVWRRWGGKLRKTYFLDFCNGSKNLKRIGYGVSFGVDCWEYIDKETRYIKNQLSNFDAMSVREKSGIELINKYLGMNAEQVLDPTLLLKINDYDEILRNLCMETEPNYMATYILDDTEEKKDIIGDFAFKLNLRQSRLGAIKEARMFNLLFFTSECIWPRVEQWLYMIKKAQFVITDSFHGMVFSIIFHKPFAVLNNDHRGAARIVSLLEMFGLMDRIVREKEDVNKVIGKKIDWDKIDEVIDDKRQESIAFIKQNLC